jgi:hypothetical protein
MRGLSKLEHRWARAVLGAMFPSAPEIGIPTGLADVSDLGAFLDGFVTGVPLRVAFGLRLAVIAVALSPLFVLGRLATFAGLSRDEGERVLATLAASRLYLVRQLIVMLKATGAFVYGALPAVRARMEGAVAVPSVSETRLVADGVVPPVSGTDVVDGADIETPVPARVA